MKLHLRCLVTLLTLFCVAECSVRYITPNDNSTCPANNTCLTLSRLFSNATLIIERNLSLIFLPGDHRIDSTLSLSNISELSMNSAEGASTTTITCGQLANVSIYAVDYVLINGLRFIACEDSSITQVTNLTLWNSIFEAASDRSRRTKLTLNEINSAHVSNSSFLFNTWASEESIMDNGNINTTDNGLYSNKSTQFGGALVILNSCNIVIVKSLFEGNEAKYGGAVYTDHNSSVVITSCIFRDNRAVGTSNGGGGGAIFMKYSKVDIYTSSFMNNSVLIHPGFHHNGGALVAIGSEISITGSVFINNTARNGIGGVIFASDSTFVIIERCAFTGNEAHIAGVMYLQRSSITIGQSKLYKNGVSSTNIENGFAIVALYNSSSTFIDYNEFQDNHGSLLAYNAILHFKGQTDFYNCTSLRRPEQNVILHEGGGISAYSSHLIFQGYTNFTLNHAKYGGGLFAVESTITISTENSQFTQQVIAMHNNTATSSAGGMYLFQSTLQIKEGKVSFVENYAFEKGGGVFALNSDISLVPYATHTNSSLLLAENIARFGGGFYLEGTSKLNVYSSSSIIILRDNYAEEGAAIYVDDYTKVDTCYATPTNITPATECFLYILYPHNLSLSDTRTESILFHNSNTTAVTSTIFGGLLDRCASRSLSGNIQLSKTIDEQNVNGLRYLLSASNINNINSITSEPVQVCKCSNGLPDCTIRSLSIQVRKGESFTIQVAAVNQVRTPIEEAKIFGILHSTQGEINQNQKAQMTRNCTDLAYTVRSYVDSETLTLYADGPCKDAEVSRLSVNVNFSTCTCPVGFEPSSKTIDTSCDCVCNSLIRDYVEDCQLSTSSFVRNQTNSWLSYTTKNNKSIYIVGNVCPFGFCRTSSTLIRINLNNENGADVQCSEGRTGMLCGSCAANYSISLGSTRCIRCPDNWYLLFVVIIIGSILAGLGLAISIMAINFTVSVGTINGFIFYGNIVDVYDNIFLPFDRTTFPTLVIGWLNLNPSFDMCLVKGLDMYARTWFRFIFPAYIISIVIVILVISHHSPRFARLIGKRNPLATLATLLLLSYTSIVEISLIAMTPETLQYITSNGSYDTIVWKPDGNMRFFEAKHATLFFFALILVILSIAYNILIFSWQWIIRLPKLWILKWTRNQKLNLFIRVHHAPYSDQHRYWTGLLLLVRALLIITSTFTETIDPKISLLTLNIALGALFLLKMTLAKKVYKMWPVDALEVVMIFNLFVLASVSWYALDDANTRRTASYISISITFILLLCVIGYHIYRYVLVSIWPSLKVGQTAVRFYPAQRATTVPGNPSNDYAQDRFYDIIGSIYVQADQPNQRKPAKPKRTPKSGTNPVVNKVVATTSVLDLFESQEQCGPAHLTDSEEESHSPYVMMDATSL